MQIARVHTRIVPARAARDAARLREIEELENANLATWAERREAMRIRRRQIREVGA